MSPNLPRARFLNSFRQPRFSVPVLLLLACTRLSGIDFTEGVLTALPVRDGKPPAIDGALGDWDLSAQEPVYISAQTAAHMNAEWAFMYDDDAFYVSARVAMPMRPYRNPSGPQDAFWSHDLIQMRLVADPAQAYPLNAQRDAQNDRVAHLSFWQNSDTGGSYLQITRGTKLNLGKVLNPPGSEVAFGHDTTAGFTVIEAKIPWSALNVPGGKNPFKPGDKTAAVIETLWIGGDSSRVAAGFRQDPGSFAFLNPHTWGQLQFAEKSPGKRIRPTLKSILAGLEQSKRREPGSSVGVPISFDVPEDDLKASVNILGANGEVLRELVGGETFAKGRQTVKWDGRDAWGRSLPPGNYTWGAYLHRGLKAEFVGSVGTAGTPPFPTADGRGGWGGDHSNPVACAADASGIYLLWPVSEAGKALVKIDQDGRVVWRQNPFVGGGFGPFFSVATDGRHVYLTRGTTEVFLVRLDAETGALLTWGEGGPSEFPLYKSNLKSLPSAVAPVEVHDSRIHMQLDPGHVIHPDPVGMAVHEGRIYVSHYSQDKILVVDAATGKQLGELSCPGPRGLAVDHNGLLYAASYKPDVAAQVMRFDPKSAQPTVMISRGLEAPYGIAVAADGRIYVSDTGASQQIKLFSADGKPQKAIGTKGGRPWQGRYDPDAFLNPAGLTLDKDGALIVAESSPPKVFSRFSASGDKLMDRWFGPGVYWNSTWPMPEDPTHVFYLLNEAIGRARISGPETPGIPDAYWDPARAGFPQVGNIEKNFPTPTTLRADNGKLYLVGDIGRHAIFLFENDVVRPVATWLPISANNPDASGKGPGLDVWVDANADGLVQPNEKSILTKMPDGSALGSFAEMVGSMRMEPNGDLFFVTHQNRVLKVPAKGFDRRGQISWDIARISWAIPEVLPGAKSMPTSWRMGILGVDRDSAGNY
ncbi:MAG: FlgD immunoglobulin-like domain containing protein, partial [Verrucomicrobiota bacterium]